MKTYRFYRILFAIAVGSASAFADSDIRIVKAEFNRCSAVIDRFERSLMRYEDAVNALERITGQLSSAHKDIFSSEILSFENRREYFNNRFERLLGQADKIRDDLKNVSGPTCSSCISSNISMFCRTGETLQNEITEYLSNVSDLHNRIILKNKSSTVPPAPSIDNAVYSQRRITADSLLHIVQSCDDPAAVTLRTQVAVNLKHADSLYGHNNKPSALTVLEIAESLLHKTLQRCNEK
jgi:hypothetical protein